jgi:hypothetical protein
MLLLVLVALAVPAVSLAGGSAGDQQYTDPFAGGSGSRTAPSTTTSSPAPAQTTSSAPPSTTPAAPTGTADPATVAAASTTASQPTATMATSSPMLPYTGYDAWTAVGFGLVLVGGGVALRWRVRGHRC